MPFTQHASSTRTNHTPSSAALSKLPDRAKIAANHNPGTPITQLSHGGPRCVPMRSRYLSDVTQVRPRRRVSDEICKAAGGIAR